MSSTEDDEPPTARELRIIELEDLIEAGGSEDDKEKWERELQRISFMTDEAYEESLPRNSL